MIEETPATADEATATDKAVDLPPPPDLITEISQASVDVNNLGSIIEKHEELTEEILDTINAPYFNLVRNISSLDEAVRFLGQERIIKLTTARSLKTALFTRDHAFSEEIWTTSNRTAIACVLVAKELNTMTPDEAYELGLYHNMGMAILFNHFSNYRTIIKSAYKHESGAISAFETHHLRMNHAEVGANLSELWKLEPAQIDVIRHHHNQKWINKLFKGEDSEKQTMMGVLKLAEYISNLPGLLAQTHTNYEWLKIEEAVMEFFDLNEMKLEKLKRAVKEGMAEVKI